jgi:hypothetical protein
MRRLEERMANEKNPFGYGDAAEGEMKPAILQRRKTINAVYLAEPKTGLPPPPPEPFMNQCGNPIRSNGRNGNDGRLLWIVGRGSPSGSDRAKKRQSP